MSKKYLSAESQKKISLALGREIDLSQAGDVQSFLDFSDSDIEDFRTLEKEGGVLAVAYIRFRISGNIDLNTVVSYYGCVVQQGMPVEKWIDFN